MYLFSMAVCPTQGYQTFSNLDISEMPVVDSPLILTVIASNQPVSSFSSSISHFFWYFFGVMKHAQC